ncbi:MAG: hypothetical protein JWQ90_682 [Hydrocarboniphaga sp.]|uniref:DUF6683 family protein n=1 Tax=Hydrocarboniphaga sp. TaxID=2033016 RepID=UPI0026162FA9|nr:DUF6683 family protein [Hydrocarboniphaga sp.]MDB5968232.1 hypothetical protein [Hydrocarboniphaga sp.]
MSIDRNIPFVFYDADMIERCAASIFWLLIVASVLPAPCRAEDVAPLPSLYLSASFYNSLIQKVSKPTLAAGQRSLLGKAGPPPLTTTRDGMTETLTANLNYQPSDGISRTLRQQIASKVQGTDPAQMPKIREAFSSDAIWQQFDQLLRGSGYNARDIADVVAAYYLSAWEIVNRATASPGNSRVARDRIAWSLKRSPEIMFMSDAEKQRSAETLGILTTVPLTGSKLLLQRNDEAGYATLQECINQSFLQQGIDFRQLALGRNGFVAR